MCLRNTHLVLCVCGGGISSHSLLRLSTKLYRAVETKSPDISNHHPPRGRMKSEFQINVLKFSPTKRLVARGAVAQNEEINSRRGSAREANRPEAGGGQRCACKA